MSQPGGELEHRAQGRVGTTLRGKYRLDRVLGAGGMAVVYLATHRNQAQFALKMLHPELSMHEGIRSRFLREGYAANSVKHPGAVLVVDDDVAEDGAAFLVMELLDGQGVEQLLARLQRIPARAAAGVAYQLLDVLAAAHDKGIVHRDIKPANLFLMKEGVVKVLDFGIARARDAAASGVNMTGTGTLLGTPAFMSPEQALGKTEEVDALSDLWSVGATLFTLVTGHYVHEAASLPEMLVQAATAPARSLGVVAPETPPPIVAVVDGALAFDRRARWRNATAMRDGLLEAFRASYGCPPTREELAALLGGAVAPDTERRGPSATTPEPRFDHARGPTGTVAAGPGDPVLTRGVEAGSAPRLVGGTTATPVANRAESPPSPRGWVLGTVAAVVVLASTALVIVKVAGGTRREASSAGSASMTVSAAPIAAPPLSATSGGTMSDAAQSSTSASFTSVAGPPTRPPSNTTARPFPPAPGTTTVPTPPKPNCKPDYTIDANGDKHFKPECFH